MAQSRLDSDTETFIDALRGFAAICVMITHSVDLGVAGVFGWEPSANPESWRWARASIGHGGYWVWCFFVISGFCIQQSIARSVRENRFSFWRYMLARVSRIYPLFLVGLGLAIIAWLLHADPTPGDTEHPVRQFAASLCMLQIFTSSFPCFEQSWSLSNEMMYYIAWPLVLLLCGGAVTRAAWTAIALTLIPVIAVFVAWKGFHRMETSAAVGGIWAVTAMAPVWLCGAWLSGNLSALRSRVTLRLWYVSIMLCVVSASLLVVLKFFQYPSWSVQLASWSAIPGMMLFIAGAPYAKLGSKASFKPVATWLGNFSYPCYILHFQLLVMLDRLVVKQLGDGMAHSPVMRSVLLFFPTFALLAFIAPRLERTIMLWRARVLNTRAPAQTVIA